MVPVAFRPPGENLFMARVCTRAARILMHALPRVDTKIIHITYPR
jgi:hypothetical protein